MATDTSLILKNINYEIFSIVWLDSQINNLPEYINIQEQLRTIINYLKIFENIDQCEEYIRLISNYDRIILIINNEFAQDIISRIHQLRQISFIYIYDTNKEINEQWIKQYPKVKCVMLQLDELLKEIQSDQTKWNQNKIDEPFSISIFKTIINQDQSIIELNNQFIYSQLLIDCLLRMDIDLFDRMQIIILSREIYKNNKIQLDIIEEFEQTYSSNQSLSWYTRDIFLSKILNKALYIENLDIIFLFRFFLRDIRQELEQNQYSSFIHLYRSQLISNDELQLLKDSIGEFISINSFFLTKFNRQLALADFDNFILSENLHPVLFEIDANPQLDNIKPFSHINSSEILMMFGSIFRLINIYFHDDQLWIIQIKLCSINDENFKFIFDYTKRKIGYNDEKINILTFGNILWKMNKLDQAEKYYLYLIHILPHDYLYLIDLYSNLGHVYSDKNEYDLSLKYYNKSLEICIKILKIKDSNLANNYNAIATNYWKKNDYKHAYESFTKALEIFKEIYGEYHINVAMCLNNIATVLSNQKNYSKALNFYLKALIIFQKQLSTNHPNLASLHCNISTIYKNLNQIYLAIEHLIISLNIYQKSFPFNHSNIIIILKNIAFLYEEINDFQQALSYYEKISNIYRQTLTSTDPNVVQNEEKIQYLLSLQTKKHSIN